MKPTAWIVVPAYDCAPYLHGCLASIRAQDYEPVRVVVIDDASPGDEMADMVRAVDRIDGWTGIVNDVNIGATANIYNAVHDVDGLGIRPDPDDVVILVDGDDRLAGSDAVSAIMDVYASDPNVWLTYGSYRPEPWRADCPVPCPYPTSVVRDRSFRTYDTVFNHPLTFRAFVLTAVEATELRLADGSWVPHIYDEAFMYPALEMVGPNHRFLPDVHYIYHGNTGNNCTADPVKVAAITAAGTELRARPPAPRMFHDDGTLVLGHADRGDIIARHMLDHHLTMCVETGTGYGAMAERLSTAYEWVDRVITIESDDTRYRAACARLLNHPRVQPVHADSVSFLRDVGYGIGPACWFLSAHRDPWWVGNPSVVSPLMDELYLILGRPGAYGTDVVLIVDAHLLGRDGFPSLGAVRSQVANIAPSYTVTASYGIVTVAP